VPLALKQGLTMRTGNRKNIYILAFTLLVVMLGFGVVIPILPFYIENLGAGGTELGLLAASYAVMRLIFGPIWGALSDRVGRKPILMIGILGYGITMFWFGLATQLWMLFVARTLSGILSSATSPTTMAYIGDSTPEDERGHGMGVLGAAVGLGTILGPGLGGLLGEESLSLPFFIAGGMAIVALVFIALFLPESLPKEARRAPEGERSSINLRHWLEILRGPMSILFFMGFLVSYAITLLYGIFGLYALQKFGYGTDQVGGIFMVVGLVSALAQGVLTGPLTRRWGEAAVIKIALLMTAMGFVLMSWAGTYTTILLTVGFFTLATALLSPAVSSLTSRKAGQEQGTVMGLSNAVMSLGRAAGPLWGGIALDLSLELPYLSGAVVIGVGFLIAWVYLPKKDLSLNPLST
jgi:DHA1 family multidrug resistance protein-like MFS transporter